MRTKILSVTAALFFLPAALFGAENSKNCGCACCKDKEVCCCHKGEAASTSTNEKQKTERHPLKGVIVEVQVERSSLLVKHEDIPGVMRAMTMLFKVDANTLTSVTKGQAITGTLVQRDDGFWLEDVKPAK